MISYTLTLNGERERPVTFDRLIVRGGSGKVVVSIGQLMDFLEKGILGENTLVCFEKYANDTKYETCIPSGNIEGMSQYIK